MSNMEPGASTDRGAPQHQPGEAKRPWWETATIYQIYPRSFQDTNRDGIGDLRGIEQRLDYLAWLGVDAIWISPIYPSPMADGGYDVANYCDVDPMFGALADFDRLLGAAHARGIKVILDFVPNHTSDQHPWFVESRASRTNAKRDWYVWGDPEPGGEPPTNWTSRFGGSAWEWDDRTGQYYYHAFLKAQPDLNWRNPAVRDAMLNVLRFWLDRGVDGFRVDAVTNLVEDDLLRDDPPPRPPGELKPPALHVARVFTDDRPETHAYVADMRSVLDGYGGRVLIGEAHLPVARVMSYYGGKRPGFHLPFNFILLQTPWDARSVEAAIDQYTILLPEGGWPNWVLGNHDERRVASRIGHGPARVAAMLLTTLRGTPFIYYGDELGLEDTPLNSRDRHDPVGRRDDSGELGRDPQRTPMPWDDSPCGGFTDAKPWLPLGEHARRNVEAERADPRSLLHLYRRLLAVRRSEPALASGGYAPARSHGDVLAFWRQAPGQRLLVLLNFGGNECQIELPAPGRVLLSTDPDRASQTAGGTVSLQGDEGAIVQID